MLSIRLTNERHTQLFEHEAGPLEIGRGPQGKVLRIVVDDNFVSRDHLSLEELPGGRLRVKNLSQTQLVQLPDGSHLERGASRELGLPLHLEIGRTALDIEAPAAEFLAESYQTVARPPQQAVDRPPVSLRELGASPPPEKIASWLETVIALQRSSATTRDFYDQTARALVELVGLDLGMVLLRAQTGWELAGHHATSSQVSSRYSRTLLAHVLAERRTFFQSRHDAHLQAESLLSLDAVVASPIFGLNEDIAGVLYGVRTWRGGGGIQPLEAQLVQLLAGTLGANLTRTLAIRTRTQFEQFFSSELVRELERDPNLLEGRNQEVTIMFTDLRGFTRLSERLGPEMTCRIVRDAMERLTERIAMHGGVVVDYAGDGILSMWNAPVLQPDHAVLACRTALAMLAELPGLNARWETVCGTPLGLGIGINTGPALVGNTGSSRRLKYGPFGLTVNLASRIQDATKRMGVPLLVSSSVQQRVRGSFRTRPVGTVALAGVSEEVPLHELCGEAATIMP